MAAADPELRKLQDRRAAAEVTGFSVMGRWWKPVAALTAAATAILLLTPRAPASPEPPKRSIALSLVAAEGDPVTLWRTFAIQADPVLALIAFQPHGDLMGRGVSPTSPQEENR